MHDNDMTHETRTKRHDSTAVRSEGEKQKNMAAVAETADMTIVKNSEILVKVEEALADLIVVSYCADDKKFQGVLLDSNKGLVLAILLFY